NVEEATNYAAEMSPEKLGVPDFEGVVSWFSMLVLITIGAAIYPHAIQRIYAAGSELTLRRSLTWMAWAPFVTSGFVFLIGIIGIKALSGLSEGDSEQLVGMMANHIASQNSFFYWAMVILFGGIVAAIVSTADSVLLTLSSVISKDIYAKYINKNASDQKQIYVGKVLGVIIVIGLLLLAWYTPATLYQIFILIVVLLISLKECCSDFVIVVSIVSTADSVLLTLSSVIYKDIYAKYINKNASDQKQIFVGKVLGVIIVIGLLLLAWYPPATLYQIFILKFELLIQIAPAFIIGLYWKRMHAGAVFTGMLVGTVVASYMAFNGLTP